MIDGIPGRQAQRVGGEVELVFGVAAGGGDDGFEPRLFLGQLVEVGILLGVGGVHGFQLGLGFHDFAHAGFDFLAHGLVRVELRLLRQVADAEMSGIGVASPMMSVSRPAMMLQHGGFARAVQAEQADLGAGEEAEGDVLEDLALRRHDLADAVHGEDVLGHGVFCSG